MENQSHKKIALIGMSGAGKSECIKALSCILQGTEMDHGLNPATPQDADTMLTWILKTETPLVTVSVHKEGLKRLALIKTKRDDRFEQILFVYLYTSKESLQCRLMAQQPPRAADNIRAALQEYEEIDSVLNQISDYIVQTDALSVADVAKEIKNIFDHACLEDEVRA